MQPNIHAALLNALATILRPLAKLLLQSGVSFDEFTVIAKTVFVQVATDDFKRRGRPANFSEVSAMTGISRRDVSRIRDPDSARWNPNMEISPVNTLLHHWHFDADFSDGAGHAHPLPFEGPRSFSDLVERHIHDLPPGALRATLLKAGVATETTDELLVMVKPFFYSRRFDEDYIHGLAFSLAGLGSTIAHNATVHRRSDLSNEEKRVLGRLERVAWSEHLSEEGILRFKAWVEDAATQFLVEGNSRIGENELPTRARGSAQPRAIGVGVYYFEEDRADESLRPANQ